MIRIVSGILFGLTYLATVVWWFLGLILMGLSAKGRSQPSFPGSLLSEQGLDLLILILLIPFVLYWSKPFLRGAALLATVSIVLKAWDLMQHDPLGEMLLVDGPAYAIMMVSGWVLLKNQRQEEIGPDSGGPEK